MKLKITITGPKVHDVGYRPWLTEKAVDLALRGFEVYNDAEGDLQSVVALVDSDKRRATQFFEFAKAELPPLARIDDIRSEPYDEEIQPLWQSATLGTFVQINKAVPILQEMREDLREVKTNTNLIPEIAEGEYPTHPGDRGEYPSHSGDRREARCDHRRDQGLAPGDDLRCRLEGEDRERYPGDKSQDRHQIDPKTNSGKDPQEGKFITFSGPGNCDRSLTIDSPSLLRNVFFRNLA